LHAREQTTIGKDMATAEFGYLIRMGMKVHVLFLFSFFFFFVLTKIWHHTHFDILSNLHIYVSRSDMVRRPGFLCLDEVTYVRNKGHYTHKLQF